jgi:hypothetical protein
MVPLPTVQEWNNKLEDANVYPAEPIAVVTGGTNGIGAATAKSLAKYTVRPRIYILGRSQETANAVIAECKTLNPEGTYIFKKVDLSLIRNVDAVSEEIKEEIGGLGKGLNILVLSAGGPDTLKVGTFLIQCIVLFRSGMNLTKYSDGGRSSRVLCDKLLLPHSHGPEVPASPHHRCTKGPRRRGSWRR